MDTEQYKSIWSLTYVLSFIPLSLVVVELNKTQEDGYIPIVLAINTIGI